MRKNKAMRPASFAAGLGKATPHQGEAQARKEETQMTNRVRFIGDVHGKFGRYGTLLRAAQSENIDTIQLGDMGVGFIHPSGVREGEWANNPPYRLMTQRGSHRFIRGNHDNPHVCPMHSQWIADGTVEDRPLGPVMFIGGAVSIDRAFRVENFTWWPDEELSTRELDMMLGIYRDTHPCVMVTHDAPERIAERMTHSLLLPSLRDPNGKLAFASRTRQAFDAMLDLHAPELWLFGHWHRAFDETINGTRFVCLPELATMDIEL